ncbi:hypothetical protein BDZ91DRAFT_762412 [Kalaharituber pfeilii]|nr:hypothetical protein BDZ91DRAFT_762412 [Kalaharituber pfeilii]
MMARKRRNQKGEVHVLKGLTLDESAKWLSGRSWDMHNAVKEITKEGNGNDDDFLKEKARLPKERKGVYGPALESDDSKGEKIAEQFEQGFNLRFEDFSKADQLVGHAPCAVKVMSYAVEEGNEKPTWEDNIDIGAIEVDEDRIGGAGSEANEVDIPPTLNGES